MAKTPITRDIAWISLVPQLSFMGLLIFIYSKFNLELLHTIMYGTATYLLISFSLRKLFCRNFAEGMKLVKQEQFSEAIPFFEKNVCFFTRNQWLDKFRYIALLSSSKKTYKEMGLCNIAFCYSQMGNGAKAKEYYERTRDEFPNNEVALTALKLIASAEKNNK